MFHRSFILPAGLVLAASLTTLLLSPAAATTYYVSPLGNDANAGTAPTAAWRTLNRVNSRSFKAGDAILLEGGARFEGALLFKGTPRSSANRGKALRPIRVGSYGTGRAIISAGRSSGIELQNTAGYRIQDLVVAGNWDAVAQSGNDGSGVRAFCSTGGGVKLNYLRIENVDVSGFRNAGIEIRARPTDGSKSGYSNISIVRCSIHDNGDAGILSRGYWDENSTLYAHQNFYIGYTTVYNNQGISGTGLHSGNGIMISDVDGATIERCVAHTNGAKSNWGSGGPVGIWAWDVNNVKIQCNEAYNNRSATTDGGGFDLDGGCTNSVLQYNYSHDNAGSGYLLAQFEGARPFHSNVVRYNISENDGRRNSYAGLHLWNGGSGIVNCQIYNNTVFISPSASGTPKAVRIDSATSGVTFRNNLLIATGGLPLVSAVGGQVSMAFQGNAYWGDPASFRVNWSGNSFSSLLDWQKFTGQEMLAGAPTGLNMDPLLNAAGDGGMLGDASQLETLAAYQLQSGSALRGAGINLSTTFGIPVGPRDFFSNPVGTGAECSIGAHNPPAD